MQLYNPKQVNLPVLKINKIHDRQVIENDPTVMSLLNSKLLLDSKFNKICFLALEKSKKILQLLKLSRNQIFQKYALEYYSKPETIKPFLRNFVYLILAKKPEYLPKEYKGKVNKSIRIIMKEAYQKLQGDIVGLSDEIQNMIKKHERKNGIKLSILSSTTLYICKNCAKIISLDEFKQSDCDCGYKIDKTTQVVMIPVYHFNNNFIKFLELNYWFEHGVDYLLRKKNFKTLVGYQVLGHSGVLHEIDNIADSKTENYRFFCECKTGAVKVKDIFVFYGKMSDVGCTRGYVFTTADSVSQVIVRLARSKNMDIVIQVLKRNTASLLKNIKEG